MTFCKATKAGIRRERGEGYVVGVQTRGHEGNDKHRSLLRRLSLPLAMITHVGHARGASRSISANKPFGVLQASTPSQLLGLLLCPSDGIAWPSRRTLSRVGAAQPMSIALTVTTICYTRAMRIHLTSRSPSSTLQFGNRSTEPCSAVAERVGRPCSSHRHRRHPAKGVGGSALRHYALVISCSGQPSPGLST